MRVWIVPKGSKRAEDLRQEERPTPSVRAGQVRVRVRATSLNYRDQAVVAGVYVLADSTRDTVPLSDGAGEVVAVGEGVTRFTPGDRVAGTFFQTPPNGPPSAMPAALGAPLDGMLAEEVVLYEDGLVHVPQGYSFEEAACLPCAGVTAWHALMRAGRSIRPGDTVLVLGTGGVSTFALQFARAAGARVIATSSSDEKLRHARSLGAAEGINYKTTPEWDKEVLRLTGGRGVDCVVEVGGLGTLPLSMSAVGRGGKITLIGVLTGHQGGVNPHALMFKGAALHGIFVGDRPMFEEMNRAIETNGIKPVIDTEYEFDRAVDAFRQAASRSFVGKIVIRV
ncbi:MAG TPA: NAD(P)-dependent alcohol dehydrogenase [Vicinamibacterales bacterium]|nr:NAD(P)-dependent alcohol dehydrogenase [Vicinamibacterales bacterium]